MREPAEHPTRASGRAPAETRRRRMPRWAIPRTPPEPRTRVNRGRVSPAGDPPDDTSAFRRADDRRNRYRTVGKQIQLHPLAPQVFAGAVDTFASGVLQNLHIKGLKARAVVEVAKVSQLVTEGVDEAGIFERTTASGVVQPQGNSAVRITDPVAAAHIGSLREDFRSLEAEVLRESCGVAPKTRQQQNCFRIIQWDWREGGRPPPQTPQVP